jgi:arylsulfatase A-like enzyme
MPDEDATPPNVLFVLLDELRPDVFGCYGHPFVETPTVDRLAAEGVRFEEHVTNAPQCVPARAALMTSLYPHQNEVQNNSWFNDPSKLPAEFWDYLEFNPRLRDAGYGDIVNVGKWHAPVSPEDAGFDRSIRDQSEEEDFDPVRIAEREDIVIRDRQGATPFYAPEGTDESEVVRKLVDEGPIVGATHPGPIEDTYTAQGVSSAIDEIESLAAAEDPWFVRLSLNRPHTPVIPPEPYATMYDDEVTLPEVGPDDLGERPPIVREMATRGFSDDQLLRLRSRYLGMVTFIDDQLRRIYDRLEELGIAEDTLTVFTADHGSAIGDHGFQTKGSVGTRGVIGTPLVVHWPGELASGRSHGGVTQLMDLYPTMLDLVGADVPEYVEGASLGPVLRGSDEDVHDEVFVELTLGGNDRTASHRMETVRTREWRYTRYPAVDQAELIDLAGDPGETRDVSDANPDRAAAFDARLDEWLADTPPISEREP